MSKEQFSCFLHSDSLLARNEHTHLTEPAHNHEQVIMTSPRHGKTSNKVHRDTLPRSAWYGQCHVQLNFSVVRLVSAMKNTAPNKSRHFLLHLWRINIPLQIFHHLFDAKMLGYPGSMSFSHQLNSNILWYA
jgi:hypothetical protein